MYESTACARNSTPVLFAVYSKMCVMGGCGKYGRCYQFFSGGNMFSTCQCFAGYRGWGCTDASQVRARWQGLYDSVVVAFLGCEHSLASTNFQ